MKSRETHLCPWKHGIAAARALGYALALGLLFALPSSVHAHGELHLRISELTARIQAASNNTAALYLERAELQRQHGDFKAATADLDQAERLDPTLSAVDVVRARVLTDLGQLKAARAMFDRAIKRNPRQADALLGRARLLLKSGERKAAIEDYRNALALTPKAPAEGYLELAEALAAEGQVNEALGQLDRGIQNGAGLMKLQACALELELGRNNTNSALTRLEQLINHAERKETWLVRQGDLLLAASRPADARRSYEAALAAIDRLPPRLQQSPSMAELRSQAQSALGKFTNAPGLP